MLTIVSYHYIRDLQRSRYPKFNGLNTKDFEGQLDYIEKHYTVCSMRQVVSATRGEDELPKNACLLTFDDGFLDHYMTAFPRLVERGMSGCFYPVVRAAEEGILLNTHKLHFILSSVVDHRKVVDDIFRVVGPFRKEHDIPDDEELYKSYTSWPSPDSDSTDTLFIKRIQHVLPDDVRTRVMDELFTTYVNDDEEILAAETYMDLSQLRQMARQGMEVGGHGNSHTWLTQLGNEELREELKKTLCFLTKIYGYTPEDWSMNYPNGKYNKLTTKMLGQSGCTIGLAAKVDLVYDLSTPMELSRLDTNDLPVSGHADICEWTRKSQIAAT